GPLVGVFADEVSSSSSVKGKQPFYILLEPSNPAGLPTCYKAKEIASQSFIKSKGSLTSRLRDCLKSLHENITTENSASLPQNRFSLGAVCLTVRGNDLFVAQAGPSLVYVISEDGVKKVAPSSQLPAAALTALGTSKE